MKRIIGVFCLLQLVSLCCVAQEKGDYFVRYVKEHLLYSQGEEVNVIDVDLEWPDAIDGADLGPLHTYLIKELMGLQSNDFDRAMQQFKSKFGQPVAEQFASAPVDAKMCYVDLSLKLLAHEQGRYVSYEMKGTCKPGSASKHKASEVSKLLTYDLVGLGILERDDVLRHTRLEYYGFSNIDILLPSHSTDEMFMNLSINDACLAHDKVLVRNSIYDQWGNYKEYQLMIAPGDLSRYLSKEAKSLLKPLKKKKTASLAVRNISATGLPSVGVTDLCTNPDTKPEFQLPGRTLSEYLTSEVKPVDSEVDGKCYGNVLVRLTIDQEGFTRYVSVQQPLAPAYDREAVRVVKNLPRWKPAMKDGQPVATQVIVGIEFAK
ncbi:MAG: energy transducer TonB [Prevotella sp.]|nr:energy transducer TonB [Prevotella sp.]